MRLNPIAHTTAAATHVAPSTQLDLVSVAETTAWKKAPARKVAVTTAASRLNLFTSATVPEPPDGCNRLPGVQRRRAELEIVSRTA